MSRYDRANEEEVPPSLPDDLVVTNGIPLGRKEVNPGGSDYQRRHLYSLLGASDIGSDNPCPVAVSLIEFFILGYFLTSFHPPLTRQVDGRTATMLRHHLNAIQIPPSHLLHHFSK